MSLADALFIFETETLVTMSHEAWIVSRAKVNDDVTRALAAAAMDVIETELQARGYPLV